MSEQLIDWLKDDLISVKADVKEIKAKVDELLQFKWQIISGSVVISAIVGIILQVLIAWVGK
jgi:hypothetical protein